MSTAIRFRQQAVTCANMANQTHDEECRQRCLRLEQLYLHLAEEQEQPVGQIRAFADTSEKKPAA